MTVEKYIAGWQSFARRYGGSVRQNQRRVKDGIHPEPLYFEGSRIPHWEIAVLDESDRAKLSARPRKAAGEAAESKRQAV